MAEWISVNDRLPNGECLTISMVKGRSYKEYLIGWIAESQESESGYVCEGDGIMLDNVTHWMPLPDPPEEIKE